MEQIQLIQEKILKLVREQKALFILVVLIFILGITTISIQVDRAVAPKRSTLIQTPVQQTQQTNQQSREYITTSPPFSSTIQENKNKQSPFNLLESLFSSQTKSQSTTGSNKPNTVSKVPTVGQRTSQQVNNTAQTISPTVQTSTNTQGSGQSTSAVNPTLNVPTISNVTNIQINFQAENGQIQTYAPPSEPPIEINWARYINQEDHYAIDYPSGWQMIKAEYSGHEGISLYMPEEDPSNENTRSVAFIGWNINYLSNTTTYTTSIMLNGVPGTLYTNGPIGNSSISVVFQHPYGYFALGSNSSDQTFLYIFDHMLRSISFN